MNILLLEWYPYIDKNRIVTYMDLNNHTIYTHDDTYNPHDIHVAIARWTYNIDDAFLDKHPSLQYALRVGVWLDNFDTDACKKRWVKVINKPWSNAISVAELAIRWLLSLQRKFVQAYTHIKENENIPQRIPYLSNEITTQHIGFIWFWNISQEILKRLVWFSPEKITFYDPFVEATKVECEVNKTKNVRDIFQYSDTIFIAVPLLPTTKNIINKDTLVLCKKHIKIINVSRWGITNEQDLYEYLSSHPQAWYFADVRNNEPTYNESIDALLHLDNYILTPHIWSETHEAQNRMHHFTILE